MTAKIGIDCRLSGLSHGGIGRYEVELFSRVLKDDRYSFVVYLFEESQRESLSVNISQSDERITWRLIPIRHYSLAEQVRLPQQFYQDNLDVLHVPHFNVPVGYLRPTIITIHDLLWHERMGTQVTTLPAWQYWIKHHAYRIVSRQAISHATKVIVPSRTIKETVSRLVPGSEDKITITYEGVGAQFAPNNRMIRDPKHLLYVGSLYPHKNVHLVLRGLALLPRHHLTIVTPRSAFTLAIKKEIARLHLQSRVRFEYQASDQRLLELYQSVGALVQPSFSEGFGLTGIEALACHTPLLASRIPIFQEIYEDLAIYFDPEAVTSFCEAVQKIKYKTPTKSRQQLLDRYDWDNTADLTLQVYADTLRKLQINS